MALPSALESSALLGQVRQEGWWFRAKEDIVGSFVRPYLRHDSVVLVLGSGGGTTVRRLRRCAPGCRVLGLDLDASAVALCAAEDPQGTYRIADVEQDALAAPESVDFVFALDILEHLLDDRALIEKSARCLKAGGLLVVNVPSHPWLFGNHDTRLGHHRRYRPADVLDLVRRHGFEIVHATPLFATTLVLLMFWRRLLQPLFRIRARESDVGLRLPGPLDLVLYSVARIEGWAARVGLPFGSSHFVMARRAGAAFTDAAGAPAPPARR